MMTNSHHLLTGTNIHKYLKFTIKTYKNSYTAINKVILTLSVMQMTRSYQVVLLYKKISIIPKIVHYRLLMKNGSISKLVYKMVLCRIILIVGWIVLD